MKIKLYNTFKYTYKVFNILPSIGICYDKINTKFRFSIYFSWLWFSAEIY